MSQKGAWPAPAVEHAPLDLGVMSSRPTLGVDFTLKKYTHIHTHTNIHVNTVCMLWMKNGREECHKPSKMHVTVSKQDASKLAGVFVWAAVTEDHGLGPL